MQLGFVSAIFGELPLEKVLAFAGAEGYQCVEVMCWPSGGPDRKYGGVCHIDVEGFTQVEGGRHARTVRKIWRGDFGARLLFESARGRRGGSRAGAGASQKSDRRRAAVGAVDRQLVRRCAHEAAAGRRTYSGSPKSGRIWCAMPRTRACKIGIENCPMLFPNTWPFGMNLARTPAIWRRMFEIIPSHELRAQLRSVAPGDAADRPDRADPRIRAADFSRPRQGHANRPRLVCRTWARWNRR